MPALYAHNKFGKLVIPKLPSTIKETEIGRAHV